MQLRSRSRNTQSIPFSRFDSIICVGWNELGNFKIDSPCKVFFVENRLEISVGGTLDDHRIDYRMRELLF